MKFFILITSILFTLSTWAKSDSYSSSYSSSYNSSYSRYSQDRIWANVGMANSNLVIGGSYEHPMDDFGLGGMVRMYMEGKDPGKTKGTLLAAFIRPHFTQGKNDFYISPGFGFGSVEVNKESSSAPVTILTMGFLTTLNDKISIGADTTTVHGFFSDKIYGPAVTDIMFNLRFKL